MGDGNSGNEFLKRVNTDGPPAAANNGSGSNPLAAIGDFQSQTDKLTAAASSGGFAISEEAGTAYIKALEDYLDSWAGNKGKFARLTHAPELGASPYAEQVGKHAVLVADGDDQSAKTQLEALQGIVEQARDAIHTAIANYRKADHAGHDYVDKLRQD
jgi:hypothetical protein